MADFWKSSDENIESANKVVISLSSNLQVEKESFSHVRSEIKADSDELKTSIISKIEKLQVDIATENTIMDKLTQKSENVKFLSLKLNYTNKCLDDFESENTVIKSCVSEVNQYLQRQVETRASLLIVSVWQHLADKLKPVFSMLSTIEDVSESDVL